MTPTPEQVKAVARAIAAAGAGNLWGDVAEVSVIDPDMTDMRALALAALTSVNQWRPIEEFGEPTAPSSGCGVLVADHDGTVGEAYFRNFGDHDDGWWWANTNWGDYPEPERPAPAAWMPLPDPPKE